MHMHALSLSHSLSHACTHTRPHARTHTRQTWENPSHTHPNTGAKGDNDPLDVCEIGFRVGRRGEIKQVKVLGTLAMIDEGK